MSEDATTNLLKLTETEQQVENPHSVNLPPPTINNKSNKKSQSQSQNSKPYKKCICLTCRECTCCIIGSFLSLIICITGILIYIIVSSKSVSTEVLGQPSTLTFINSTIGSDFIHLKWNPPQKTGGAYITSYTLQYKYKKINWTDIYMMDGGLSLFHNITNLNGSITYTLRINANNLAGYVSNWSNITLTTNTPTVPQPPSAPFASNINVKQNTANNYEFTIAFTPNSNGGAPITQYAVYYGIYNNRTQYTPFCSVNSSITSKLHDWEHPNCTGIITPNELSILFNFKVQSINSVGASSFSHITPCIIPSDAPQYFMCLQLGPPPILTNGAFNLNIFSYSIDMSWLDETCSDSIPIIAYELQRTDFWENIGYFNVTLPFDGLSKFVEINNLLAGIPYNLRMRSVNKYGWSDWSYLFIQTLEIGACGNYYDSKILRDNCNGFASQAPAIWVQCNGKDECQTNAFESRYGFSGNCTACWVQLNDCAMGVCVKQCLKTFNPQSCETCIMNHCSPQTEICTGYPNWPIDCP